MHKGWPLVIVDCFIDYSKTDCLDGFQRQFMVQIFKSVLNFFFASSEYKYPNSQQLHIRTDMSIPNFSRKIGQSSVLQATENHEMQSINSSGRNELDVNEQLPKTSVDLNKQLPKTPVDLNKPLPKTPVDLNKELPKTPPNTDKDLPTTPLPFS